MPLINPNKVFVKNYNTPATIAGASPTLDYRFALDQTEIDAVSLTDKLTFSRSATCSFTDSGGNLALAGANVPRFTHNASTRQSQGLLMEESTTNLLRYSQAIGTVAWTASATITLNSTDVRDPVGGFTSTKMVSTADASGVVQSVTIPSTNTYRFSVYLRCGSGTLANFRFSLYGPGSTYGVYPFNTLTTTWTRYSVTTPSIPSGTSYTISPNFLGAPTNPVYIWGAQFEAGSTETSYIQTPSNVTVTRTDSATISLAGLPATRTLVEKPAGCATISGDTLTLNAGYTIERVMVFPVSLTSEQISAIRNIA